MNLSDEQPVWIPPRDGNERPRNESRVIVGAGIGRHYRERLRSTVNHCEVYCSDAWKLWFETLPEGCPPHKESQYAFKIFAIQRCIEAGFRYILWMDSSFAPVASIEPLWKLIEDFGWFVPQQGDAKLGTWTSDQALGLYGMARDQAMSIPLVYSGLVGLDIKSDYGSLIWPKWKALHQAGAFNGPHYNALPPLTEWLKGGSWEPMGAKWKGRCSDDPRCEGHRHDESALAFVLDQLGLTPSVSGLLTLEDSKGIIGHMVPDYDVVELRDAVLQYAQALRRAGDSPDIQEAEELGEICK